MIFVYFWIFTLLVTGAYLLLAAHATVWGALLTALLGFLGANVLFALFFWVNSLLQKDQPLEKQSRVCRWTCRSVGRWLGGWAGMRVHITGREKLPEGEPFLFVSNHRSMFDPLLVIGYLPEYNISFVSKPSNLELPIAGITAKKAGFLAIDRENNREALKTILQAADYLKRGICNIGIYPEGTRNRTQELLPFHAGSFKIAQKAGVPVVVASVRGTEHVKDCLFFKRTPVYLNILECIDAETVKSMSTPELADHAKAIIEADLVSAQSFRE